MAKLARNRCKGPRMIKEILRLKEMGLSRRMIAKALECSRNTVDKYLADSQKSESAQSVTRYQAPWSNLVNWEDAHQFTAKGDPLSAYWEDRLKTTDSLSNVSYVSFWREYKRRFPEVPLDFHKVHPPGERCEIDYKGDSPELGYFDRTTMEFVPCRLFGAVLCFSQLFFPKATHTERQEDLFSAISDAFAYFGGVPLTSAVDNAKAAVHRPHRYDPDLNKEFGHFCEHSGTAPLAMRPGKPKDKNLIENSLGVFWRWARRFLRGRKFYSLGELNAFLVDLANLFNSRIQRKYGVSRRDKFEAGERSKLLPLPEYPYSFGEWKTAKVHPDSHIQVGRNFYSVPHQYRSKQVDVRVTRGLLEVYSGLQCIAIHTRGTTTTNGHYFTKIEHLPESHRAIQEATPQKAIDDATEIGPATELIVKALLEEGKHPLMHLRRVQGILRLAKRYSKEDLERACALLVEIKSTLPRIYDVENIIQNNRDPRSASLIPIKRQPNPYLRGQKTWSQTKEL